MLMGRITLYDKAWNKCTADWQRHNEKWISAYEGTIDECLRFVEENEEWFY
ncbi:hypothetical protein [Aneurinibacillus tyrosinisolvens]|uniref:hypothetical protein n=1 Tax=Aneurinibacillus tyrosinisolvens TaxID=1443435 RepID=UPI000AD61720|nr:hypothetical protein [Aneurinibacillus tyrosinisolvens]